MLNINVQIVHEISWKKLILLLALCSLETWCLSAFSQLLLCLKIGNFQSWNAQSLTRLLVKASTFLILVRLREQVSFSKMVKRINLRWIFHSEVSFSPLARMMPSSTSLVMFTSVKEFEVKKCIKHYSTVSIIKDNERELSKLIISIALIGKNKFRILFSPTKFGCLSSTVRNLDHGKLFFLKIYFKHLV